ncbi:MAG: hypothetical protein ACRCZM_10195, partial [Bacteroidales bacterium]
MKITKQITTALALTLLLSCSSNNDSIDRDISVTPIPREIKQGKEIFTITKSTTFWVDDCDSLANIRRDLNERFISGLGFTPQPTDDVTKADIK